MSKCEQFAQAAQEKWAIASDLLRLLMTNEWMWVIHSGRSGQMGKWANRLGFYFLEQIAHFLFRSQKMSDSLKKIR